MSLIDDGYELLDKYVPSATIDAIRADIENTASADLSAGTRNADKKFKTIQELVNSPLLLNKAALYLDGPVNIVRVILFNKNESNNWLVSWHQDKTVCVSKYNNLPGWGPWTVKDNVIHVQPPIDILDKIVTFRIHIDDSSLENGCLRLIPGSHKEGILDQAQISLHAARAAVVNSEARAGSVLVMKPHILHASSKASRPSNRRIIHVEYCHESLKSQFGIMSL